MSHNPDSTYLEYCPIVSFDMKIKQVNRKPKGTPVWTL